MRKTLALLCITSCVLHTLVCSTVHYWVMCTVHSVLSRECVGSRYACPAELTSSVHGRESKVMSSTHCTLSPTHILITNLKSYCSTIVLGGLDNRSRGREVRLYRCLMLGSNYSVYCQIMNSAVLASYVIEN